MKIHPIKYLTGLSLLCVTTGLFAQSPAVPDKEEYSKLYRRIVQLDPESLLKAHSDPKIYEVGISAGTGNDSIFSEGLNRWFYIDREEFHRRVATQTPHEISDYLSATYNGYFYYLKWGERLHEADLMEQAARKYPGDALRNEAEHLRVWFNNKGRDSMVWIAEKQAVIKDLERKGATWWALRVKWNLLSLTAGFGTSYPVAFATADQLIEDLEGVNNRDFPYKRKVYSEIADLYYRFRDYETAAPLLEKITAEPGADYFDNSGLRARNTLGIYYRDIGDMKRSGEYFLSVLEAADTIYMRSLHDAVALSNLGHNLTRAGMYPEAIGLYEVALPVMVRATDYSFASSIAAGMSQCFMNMGDWKNAKRWADTSLEYIRKHIHYTNPHLARELYPILAKYYIAKGDKTTGSLYVDSISLAYADYRDEFNSMLLMRARQELLAEKNRTQEEKLNAQRVRIAGLVFITLAAIASSLIILRLYRRKKAAYEKLSEQATRWAYDEKMERTAGPVQEPEPIYKLPSAKEIALITGLHEMMSTGRRYADPSLTLDALAKELGVNRNILSGSINDVTGRNFNNFLNEYRIKEAVRKLSSPENGDIYIDEIYEAVGFNSRTSFYRAFKSFTGLSPTEYKRQVDQREAEI